MVELTITIPDHYSLGVIEMILAAISLDTNTETNVGSRRSDQPCTRYIYRSSLIRVAAASICYLNFGVYIEYFHTDMTDYLEQQMYSNLLRSAEASLSE